MIIDEFVKQGYFLFRYRSFLPFAIIPIAVYYGYQFAQMHNLIFENNECIVIILSLVTSFFGFAFRVITVGYTPSNTSGRNTTEQKADVLNTTGMYSLMRHPLYLARLRTY